MSTHVVHVLSDGWFTEVVGRAFETAAPGANTFVAVGFNPEDVQVPASASVVSVSADPEGRKQLDALIAGSTVSVFHNLSQKVAGALAAAPRSVLRVWSGWGGDYYGSAYDKYAGQLDPATRKVVNGFVRPTFWAGQALRARKVAPLLRRAAEASDVFSAPVPEDLGVFRKRFPRFAGEYCQLNYATVEDSIATAAVPTLGQDILLGNSASPTNNHLDLLQMLATQNLEGRRVVTPLSYGDPAYAAVVVKSGVDLLGDRFVPITDFLPLKSYNTLVGECGTVIMGHIRQEGLGNVLRAIWQGARVMLDERNPISSHLRSNGVEVESLTDVARDGLSSGGVSTAQHAARTAYLDQHWSRQAAVRNVEKLLARAGSR